MIPPRKPDPEADQTRNEWPHHPEGVEDGYYEDWDSDADSGGYPDDEGW